MHDRLAEYQGYFYFKSERGVITSHRKRRRTSDFYGRWPPVVTKDPCCRCTDSHERKVEVFNEAQFGPCWITLVKVFIGRYLMRYPKEETRVVDWIQNVVARVQKETGVV